MKTADIFNKNIIENNLVQNGDKVIIAVSGGADSVSLLHLFWMLSKKIKISLMIAHFDHSLRKESEKEKKLVQLLSERFNIKMLFKKLPVKEYAKKNSISIETAGRQLRYEALSESAKKYRFNKIATAHNANDNAETVLMWLLRGSGNFAGIPQRRPLAKGIDIIRPLLAVKRKLIDEYIKKQKLPFCTDKSNFDDKYTRNKIRHTLIPELEKINNKTIEHISALSLIQSLEDAYMDSICKKLVKKCVKKRSKEIILDLNEFLGYNAAHCQRIIREILPEKKNNFQINLLIKKIFSLDKTPYILSKDWIFKLNGKTAVFKKQNGQKRRL
ncbi:MAG: tRNA lysidine(34) synthetase TilS [Elusimicrobiota bacterium]|jgi:tRNA(Ile)-lysidine synthase|nr:tRNA lysidine(34) synthetase TilS [Elusimicrobiota bacterium]